MSSHNIRLLIFSGIYLLTFLVISTKLDYPYLWYDEAGQFFISKGLNHDSNPLENEMGLAAVIQNNAFYNLDPGGFGILLHYWAKVSNYHIWLRMLPFLFFIGSVLCFIYLSYHWLKNLTIALLMGFVPILMPVLFTMAFEVRAYSMESVGAALGIISLEQLKVKISLKRLLLWGCVLSVFITSRYSEIVVVFVISLYVLNLVLRSKWTIKQKAMGVIAYSVPLLITGVWIYYNALVFQTMEPLPYLDYLNHDMGALFRPVGHLLYLCFVLLLGIMLLLSRRFTILKKYGLLLSVTISLHALFILLSFLGISPWCPLFNRSIGLLTITLLCFIGISGELIKATLNKHETVKYYIIPALLVVILGIRYNKLKLQGDLNDTCSDFTKTDVCGFRHIYIDRWKSPAVRYLFEYGQLKNRKPGLYPQRFTFGKFMPHNLFYIKGGSLESFYKTQTQMNDYTNYDLMVAPELFGYTKSDQWLLMQGTSAFYIKKDTLN